MNLYQNNAFRVLGLLTNATTSQIVARANELKVKNSMEFDGGYEYDLPWLGPMDRSEENISSAVQRLEDPVRRIKQELSWFWVQNDVDRSAIKVLTDRQPSVAADLWLKASGLKMSDLTAKNISPLTTPDALTAIHNLFILFQATLLRNELMAKEDEVINLLNSPTSEEDWAISLKLFNFLYDNPKFWDLVKKRMEAMQDRRLQTISLDEIKESALNNALSAHFYLITQALSGKDLPMLDKHIEILENANMPVDLYKSGLNLVLNSRIANINSLCDEFVRERKVLETKGDGAQYKNLFYKYRDSGKQLIDDCKLVDRQGMTDFVVTREKYAKSFHQLSWKLNKCGDSLGALESMNEAYKNLYSDALRLECEKDAERILQDAVLQYSSEATKLIHPPNGQAPLDKVLDVKDQYLEHVNSLFTMGEAFMTDNLQGVLREVVIKELKLIAVEVHDKYQAYEQANGVMKEAIDWAVEAKNDSFKNELETIKRSWVAEVSTATKTETAKSIAIKTKINPVLATAFGVIAIIVVALTFKISTQVVTNTPMPPVKTPTTVATSPEEPSQPPAQIVKSEPVVPANVNPLSQTPTALAASTAPLAAIVREVPPGVQGISENIPTVIVDNELRAQANKFKAQIERDKQKIKEMEAVLDDRTQEMDRKQKELDVLNNKMGIYPDSPEYNYWVSEHNALVRENNEANVKSKELYQEYQAQFQRHQALIAEYNAKFAR